MKNKTFLILAVLVFFAANTASAKESSGRIIVSLDGAWQIEDSISAEDAPTVFKHSVQVPGMVHLSEPSFPDVDLFDSKELISNRIRSGVLPESARVDSAGVPRQKRNYFWYQRVFTVPVQKAVAIIKINKAQFGTAVWLNGKKVGEYSGCFSAGHFNVTESMNWKGENRLLVRIGAHPGVLPAGFPAGTDFEKLKWTPGIYDDVSLLLSDNPVIESVQVAPRIRDSEILVQSKVKNYGPAGSFNLSYKISAWKEKQIMVVLKPGRVDLQGGEEKTITQTIRIPNPSLWTPESPFLYVLETSTGGDSTTTRFGMREFRMDTATKRAFLNGKVYFLRGSNITFHRFLEDPLSGALPWDEQWVRKLLVEIPKKMHWNSFRFCIGPVPDKWLDIADEAGLLIQNEFFIWTGAPDWDSNYRRQWNTSEMIRQYGDWMRDNWNHPSVAIWDANNETLDEVFGKSIIPAVRPLDLSNRPWENSYNLPSGPDDPVEEHPYLTFSNSTSTSPFQMSDLEKMSSMPRDGRSPSDGRPIIINEYGWLWLNRDGSPTLLTQKLYEKLLGPNATAEQRFDLYAYMLAGETEFWRAFRNYAAVLHFVYLTCSFPGVYTSDHFLDVQKLELEPHFADYMAEAFKPLGVYVNFWQPTIEAGSTESFRIMMINDDSEPVKGRLALSLESADGKELVRSEQPFALAALGQQSFDLNLQVPSTPGVCLLKASAQPEGTRHSGPTLSRRRVSIAAKAP